VPELLGAFAEKIERFAARFSVFVPPGGFGDGVSIRPNNGAETICPAVALEKAEAKNQKDCRSSNHGHVAAAFVKIL
jgi:hypothetical protein